MVDRWLPEGPYALPVVIQPLLSRIPIAGFNHQISETNKLIIQPIYVISSHTLQAKSTGSGTEVLDR